VIENAVQTAFLGGVFGDLLLNGRSLVAELFADFFDRIARAEGEETGLNVPSSAV
jgi:hypothetical protein